jgi:hypothetical protein
MKGAATAREMKPMRDRMRIFALTVALALSFAVAPAQAWPGGDHGGRPAAGWWDAVADALAPLFGLERAPRPTLQGKGSCSIDPNGSPACPEPQPTLQSKNSCSIDPNGNSACQPR